MRNATEEYVVTHRDTVSSVGVIMTRTLPFTTANTTIKTFRHALSLDEVCSVHSDVAHEAIAYTYFFV